MATLQRDMVRKRPTKISVFDYPEHLNPFREEEEEERRLAQLALEGRITRCHLLLSTPGHDSVTNSPASSGVSTPVNGTLRRRMKKRPAPPPPVSASMICLPDHCSTPSHTENDPSVNPSPTAAEDQRSKDSLISLSPDSVHMTSEALQQKLTEKSFEAVVEVSHEQSDLMPCHTPSGSPEPCKFVTCSNAVSDSPEHAASSITEDVENQRLTETDETKEQMSPENSTEVTERISTVNGENSATLTAINTEKCNEIEVTDNTILNQRESDESQENIIKEFEVKTNISEEQSPSETKEDKEILLTNTESDIVDMSTSNDLIEKTCKAMTPENVKESIKETEEMNVTQNLSDDKLGTTSLPCTELDTKLSPLPIEEICTVSTDHQPNNNVAEEISLSPVTILEPCTVPSDHCNNNAAEESGYSSPELPPEQSPRLKRPDKYTKQVSHVEIRISDISEV